MNLSSYENYILFYTIIFCFLFIYFFIISLQRDKIILSLFFLALGFIFLEPIVYIVCSKNIVKNTVFISAFYITIMILILNHYHKIKKRNTLQMILLGEEISGKKEKKKKKKRLYKKQKRLEHRQKEERKEERQYQTNSKKITRKQPKHKHDK